MGADNGHRCCRMSGRPINRFQRPQCLKLKDPGPLSIPSWRNLCFYGIEPFNLAHHFAVARERREVGGGDQGKSHPGASIHEAIRALILIDCRAIGKMSKHKVKASDVAGLFDLLTKLRERSRTSTGHRYPIISIQEAGLDGFWIHRLLQANGIESYVVDAASIAAPRRSRRARTDRIDGEPGKGPHGL